MRNLEWRNRNSLRNYPFKETAGRTTARGKIIPNDFLIDLSGFVRKTTDTRFYLSSLTISGIRTLTLVFSGYPSGNALASIVIPTIRRIIGLSQQVTGSGLATTGRAVFGEGLISIMTFGTTVETLTVDEGELEPTAFLPVNFGIVTSVGIQGRAEFLTGDVKLRFDRAMTAETFPGNNSVEISAIKRTEDCPIPLGTPFIRSINNCPPDEFGNITVSAEDLLILRVGTPAGEGGPASPGILVGTIIRQDQLCIEPFEAAARGANGGSGGGGPGGPKGLTVICAGDICCPCCDETGEEGEDDEPEPNDDDEDFPPEDESPEPDDPGGGGGDGSEDPFVVPRLAGNAGVFTEGDTITLTGVDFQQPNPPALGVVDIVEGGTFCTETESPITVPLVPLSLTGSSCQVVVPAGLTSPASPDDIYGFRLQTIPLSIGGLTMGWTNSIRLNITPPVVAPVQIENFDPPSLGSFVVGGPFLFPAPQFVEGAGAFEVQNIFPSRALITVGPLSGAGAPPWNFSAYSSFGLMYAKEFDPAEGGPADFLQLQLTDSLLNVTNVFVGVLPAWRYPAPHVLSPADFQPVTFPIPVGPADLTDIVDLKIITFDLATAIGLNAWYDDLQGIP